MACFTAPLLKSVFESFTPAHHLRNSKNALLQFSHAFPLRRSLRHLWSQSERRAHKSVRVVNFRLSAEQLLLPRLVGPVPPDLVAIFFGLEKRDQVDACPHLFAGQFAASDTELVQ